MPKFTNPSNVEIIFVLVISLLGLFVLAKTIYNTQKSVSTSNHKSLYKKTEPFAQDIKIVLQMFIGIGLAFLTILKLFYLMIPAFITTIFPRLIQLISGLRTLEIIGFALIYSTAIELAYMLFTDGPDEAVFPLITGLAAAILLGVSDPKNFNLQGAGTTALSVAILAALFIIYRYFIHPLIGKDTSDPTLQPQTLPQKKDAKPNKKSSIADILGHLSLLIDRKSTLIQDKDESAGATVQIAENQPEEKET